jgi:hypothetical protein
MRRLEPASVTFTILTSIQDRSHLRSYFALSGLSQAVAHLTSQYPHTFAQAVDSRIQPSPLDIIIQSQH